MTELILALIAAASAIVSALATVVVFLFRENRKLSSLLSECREHVASLRYEIITLQVQYEQALWTGSLMAEANIIANGEGNIIEWNPGATILLHYSAREMLGKNVTTIIPPIYREAHLAGMARLRASEESPKRGPYPWYALTKDGTIIPVDVELSGWRVDGDRFVSAKMRRRMAVAETTPEPGAHNP